MSIKFDLKEYHNAIFFETGTFKGDGIEKAIDAGFERIISIEIFKPFYEKARKKFRKNKQVKIYLGNAEKLIPNLLRHVDCNVTFFLDSHIQPDENYIFGKGPTPCPVLKEISAIGQHFLKTHTILIDDRRLLGSDHWNRQAGVDGNAPTEEQVKNACLDINSRYQFRYEAGYQPEDVIVAYISRTR
jgi:hypothetical protein